MTARRLQTPRNTSAQSIGRKSKSRAQAMLEFALALPVLLLVVYGLIETGRLLFIYASTVTAARQAIRYGSATGDGPNGVPFYQDCDGIRAAVQNVGFINRFDAADIEITYDRGVSTEDENGDGVVNFRDIAQISSPAPECDGGFAGFDIRSGDRIHVGVSTDWSPIVPLVPFEAFTISSESARTILSEVSIFVTAPAGGWSGSGGGDLDLEVTASQPTYDHVGEIITYTYTITNTGTGDLAPVFGVHDEPVATNNCESSAPATLLVGGSYACTGTYAITQEDLDTGFLTNVAQASANTLSVFSNLDGTTITAVQQPALSLTKTGDPTASSIPGAIITYTYTLTNIGNVTLRAPYTVADNETNDETCPGTPSRMEPGVSVTCTSHHTITNADINRTRIINRATATALFRAQTVTSNEATFTVYTPPIFLTLLIDPLIVNQAGQTIQYTYRLRNITDAPVQAPYTVTDSRVAGVSCAGATSPLAPGAETQCVGTYTVTQADLDAATPILNTATATAMQGGQQRQSQQVTGSVTVVWTAALTLQVTAEPSIDVDEGQVVTYTYLLTNTGNVTLSPTYVVSDDKVTGIACADASSTILPNGGTKTCTGTRTITNADFLAGSVTSVSTASATFKGQTYSSAPQTTTVTTFTGPRLGMEKSALPADVVYGADKPISYTYTLRNTGSVPLTGDYYVEDDRFAGIDCSAVPATLAVGASANCTANYTTIATDVTAGQVTNTAHGHATYLGAGIESEADSVTVYVADRACSIKHSALQYSPFRMVIFNHNAFPITLQNATITFNDSPAANQWITSLALEGATIWSNSLNHGSPYTPQPLLGNVTVPANSSKTLAVNFQANYNTSPSTDRIVVGFSTSGCGPLDSNDPGQQEPVGP